MAWQWWWWCREYSDSDDDDDDARRGGLCAWLRIIPKAIEMDSKGLHLPVDQLLNKKPVTSSKKTVIIINSNTPVMSVLTEWMGKV